jgi:23S rRNA (uridine2552-2'-O)-methyltransferase
MTAKSGRGGRDLKVRVHSGKGRTLASKLWLERQLNDPYVARAKREGLRSRAAFKLAEIDDKFHLLEPGAKVVDLGAAPGGWSQIAAQRVGAAGDHEDLLSRGRAIASPSPLVGEGWGGGSRSCGTDMPPLATPTPNPSPQGEGEEFAARSRRKPAAVKGRVVAIDRIDMPAIPGVEFLQLDFFDPVAPDRLKALLDGAADVVLSDMAANATGHRKTDHLKIMTLAEAAAMFARDVLHPGGTFLCKVLQGGTETELLADLKRDFATVKHVKPAASRTDSAELYVLALGFRGAGG